MFVSRAAARERLWVIRRLKLLALERELVRGMRAHFDRLFVNALLYGTSHPEAFVPNHGDDDVRA